jgi:predicted dehydrogenase
LTVGAVGVGGVGNSHVRAATDAGFQVVALCDVDTEYASHTFELYPDARTYTDFRAMLHDEGDKLDAVYCGTPDHTHAPVALAALKARKHVCCVKPLTRTIEECHAVVEAARRAGTATQVTAEPHSTEPNCLTIERLSAGAIGEVREVHIWSDRPLWPQGMTRPIAEDPVPASLDWTAWIGPAPMRPFAAKWPADSLPVAQLGNKGVGPFVYHPWNHRGWWDFGTGALGDMGCHHFNTVFKALELARPERVEATAAPRLGESAPLGSIVTYDFPARPDKPPVRLVWYDGGLKPPTPRALGDVALPRAGELYIGTEGIMLGNRLFPEERSQKFTDLPRTLIRRNDIFGEWLEACRGGQAAGCPFEWAGLLTEATLFGNIAIRTGERLDIDVATGQIRNNPAAEALTRANYQNGWTLG